MSKISRFGPGFRKAIVPAVGSLSSSKFKTNAKTVLLVFPIHLTMLPAQMVKYIEILDLTSAKYIGAVATRASSFLLPIFSWTIERSGTEVERLEKVLQPKLDQVSACIESRQRKFVKKT